MTTKDRASEQAETQPVASVDDILARFAEAGVWVDGDDCTGGLLQDEVVELIGTLRDTIEGLRADLADVVEVAFKRGATDYVRLNYPAQYAILAGKK